MPPEPHFLDHPEVDQVFSAVFTTLVAESDRGAVLVGFSHVDKHLKALFELIAPTEFSSSKKKNVLNYPGPLSSAAAKMDIAFMTRLIPRALHDAMEHLRSIRNEVAHSPDSFRLADHDDHLRRVYDLGPNVPAGINRFAIETMMKEFADRMFSPEGPKDEQGQPFFSTPREFFDYLAKKPEVIAILEEKRRRYELAMGIALICALIVHHRERARELIGDDETLSSLGGRQNNPRNTR